jgi:hypothetical protein
MPRRSASYAREVAGSGDRLRPPPDLGAAETFEFLRVVTSLPPSHFEPADVPMICAYARAVIGEKIADLELSAQPVLENGKVSPWLSVWQGRVRALTTISRRLKVNPAGRSDVRTGHEAPPAVSAYDKVRLTEGAFRDDN